MNLCKIKIILITVIIKNIYHLTCLICGYINWQGLTHKYDYDLYVHGQHGSICTIVDIKQIKITVTVSLKIQLSDVDMSYVNKKPGLNNEALIE
jgi:hypothetical protein